MLKIKCWASANNIVWGPRSDLAFNILNQNRQNQIFPVPLYFYKESIIILCMRSLGTLWAPTSSWRPFRPAWFCPSRPPDPCITVLDIANFLEVISSFSSNESLILSPFGHFSRVALPFQPSVANIVMEGAKKPPVSFSDSTTITCKYSLKQGCIYRVRGYASYDNSCVSCFQLTWYCGTDPDSWVTVFGNKKSSSRLR